MPPPDTPGYIKQILSKRYIKVAVLRAFIEAKIDEFGAAWTWENLNEYHTLWLKRELTRAEILEIQMKSYPEHFEMDSDG